jgi:hypothetical protein
MASPHFVNVSNNKLLTKNFETVNKIGKNLSLVYKFYYKIFLE